MEKLSLLQEKLDELLRKYRALQTAQSQLRAQFDTQQAQLTLLEKELAEEKLKSAVDAINLGADEKKQLRALLDEAIKNIEKLLASAHD